ncbi:MAG: copper amine oxidase N-terminal domain-containing protein [Capsulimonadales bacterium]|nr:copper amine oxidase N-terminal domain-containing protein [Capsulimonadales bacterium]
MPYTIQGNDVSISTEPILHENKHFIPLREIVEALGGSVSFDNETKVATAVIGPWSAAVDPENTTVNVTGNGKNVDVALTAPPVLHEGTLYVPFDFLRDAYGYNVSFDNGTVNIVNPNA